MEFICEEVTSPGCNLSSGKVKGYDELFAIVAYIFSKWFFDCVSTRFWNGTLLKSKIEDIFTIKANALSKVVACVDDLICNPVAVQQISSIIKFDAECLLDLPPIFDLPSVVNYQTFIDIIVSLIVNI